MIFLLPVGVRRRLHHRPYMTLLLLAANIVAYVWTMWVMPHGFDLPVRQTFLEWGFHDPLHAPWQMLTSNFLHAGLGHLFGNMLFLFLVGAPVEDRIGRLGLLAVYLVGGALSDLTHFFAMSGPAGETIPLVGASGSVSALMGLFFVLMPWTEFRVFYFYWIFFVWLGSGTFNLAALFLLGFYFFLMDFALALLTRDLDFVQTAHWAHVGGFVFGAGYASVRYGLGAFSRGEDEEEEHQRNLRLAVKRAQRAQKADPAPPTAAATTPSEPRLTVLRHLVRLENLTMAYKEYRRLMRDNPRMQIDPETLGGLARMLAENGQQDEARAVLENCSVDDASNEDMVRARRLLGMDGPEPVPARLSDSAPPEAPKTAIPSGKRFDLLPPGVFTPSESATERAVPPRDALNEVQPLTSDLEALRKALESDELAHLRVLGPHPGRKQRAASKPDCPCRLLLVPGPDLDPGVILRVLPALLHIQAGNLVTRLRTHGGILAETMPFAQADAARTAAASQGLGLLVIENRAVWEWPKPGKTQVFSMKDGLCRWKVGEADCSRDARQIALMACGRVRTMPGSPRAMTALDLFLAQPAEHVRVWEGETDLDGKTLKEVAEAISQTARKAFPTTAFNEWVRQGSEGPGHLFRGLPVYEQANLYHLLFWFAPVTVAAKP